MAIIKADRSGTRNSDTIVLVTTSLVIVTTIQDDRGWGT